MATLASLKQRGPPCLLVENEVCVHVNVCVCVCVHVCACVCVCVQHGVGL